jgi:hypothetical protein
MSAVATTDSSYRALVDVLSQELPKWSLSRADLVLKQDELATVLDHYGNSTLVSDALSQYFGNTKDDAFEALAIRARLPDVTQAAMSCGLAVMLAVRNYATDLVIRDVDQLRLIASTERYTDHARAG